MSVTLIGRYRLESPIGAGGMGTVWRAVDLTLERAVAVKEVRFPASVTDDERAELTDRAMREARSAARLDHPHIVAVHDVVVEDGRPWIVMRLVEGRSLDQVIRDDGPMTPAAAARVGIALVGALEAAHAAGIVHRDVKPSNVLVERDGKVLLTDFSIAAAFGTGTLTKTGILLGSPGYIAPERLRTGKAGPEADYFSLGATLYFAVEGRNPFVVAEDALAGLFAAATEEHPRPERAGPLTAALDGLLTKDPGARLGGKAARASLLAATKSAPGPTTLAEHALFVPGRAALAHTPIASAHPAAEPASDLGAVPASDPSAVPASDPAAAPASDLPAPAHDRTPEQPPDNSPTAGHDLTPDQAPDTPDHGPDAPDQASDASSQGPDLSGQASDASSQASDASGQGADVSGQASDVSGQGPGASGQGADASNQGPGASDQAPDTPGQAPDSVPTVHHDLTPQQPPDDAGIDAGLEAAPPTAPLSIGRPPWLRKPAIAAGSGVLALLIVVGVLARPDHGKPNTAQEPVVPNVVVATSATAEAEESPSPSAAPAAAETAPTPPPTTENVVVDRPADTRTTTKPAARPTTAAAAPPPPPAPATTGASLSLSKTTYTGYCGPTSTPVTVSVSIKTSTPSASIRFEMHSTDGFNGSAYTGTASNGSYSLSFGLSVGIGSKPATTDFWFTVSSPTSRTSNYVRFSNNCY